MNIIEATRLYEEWLRAHTLVVADDLASKHAEMAEDAFKFLRATFYRWAQLWPELCPQLLDAPVILSIGDLHVENFGTWRDTEGRLVWGVNDFDEAGLLSYASDLVRLAASASIALADEPSSIHPEKAEEACEAILEGYKEGLEMKGRPFVLAEKNKRLRTMVLAELPEPDKFWEKIEKLPPAREPIPQDAKEALESTLPEPGLAYSVRRRVAGLGSRGRQRLVALADWRGGKIAREAKARAPSALEWARGEKAAFDGEYETIVSRAVRCPDPLNKIESRWIVRRLSPYCGKIELTAKLKEQDALKLLNAMGRETANVHIGSEHRDEILGDLAARPAAWLHDASKAMIARLLDDWEDWKNNWSEVSS